MASREEIELEKERNRLLEENNNLLKQQRADAQEDLRIGRDINNEIREGLKSIEKENDLKRAIRTSLTAINKVAEANLEISKLDVNILQDQNKLAKLNQGLTSGRLALLREQVDITLFIRNLEGEKADANEEQRVEIEKQISAARKVAEGLSDQLEVSKEFVENLRIARKIQEDTSKIGANRAFGALGDIASKLGLGKLAPEFEKAEKASSDITTRMQRVNAERAKLDKTPMFSKGKMNVAGIKAGFKALGPMVSKALGPLALAAVFVKALFQANAETVKLQKTFLLTSEQAVDLRQDMAKVADSSGNINITATKLLGTMSSLNDTFGIVARFSDETLVNTTRLTEQVGLSANSANALAGLTEVIGENATETYENTVGTSLELAKQSGVQISAEKLFSEIAKTTGTIRANLGANPQQIARAVQAAQELGTSLEAVAAAGESMLNFQSSIEKELQAELLIGRNINLERARAAALAGDQVTLAQELQREAGSFAEFSSMNVIQQQALAEAMGMSKEQLADTLYQQELQLKGAEKVRAELVATGQDDAVRALDAQTAQDKFNKTMEKLQAIVVDVATAFMPILDIIGSIASFVGTIIQKLGPLKGVLAGAAAGTAIAPGIGTAIGAVVGGISSLSTADDAIIPAGYGETIVKKGKDTIALNNDDTVVAGTNLGGNSTPPADNRKMEALLEKLVMQNDKKPQLSAVGLYEIQ